MKAIELFIFTIDFRVFFGETRTSGGSQTSKHWAFRNTKLRIIGANNAETFESEGFKENFIVTEF